MTTPVQIDVQWCVFGGWYPVRADTGERIRGRKWREGDTPPRFKTIEAATRFGERELRAAMRREATEQPDSHATFV